MSILDRMYHRLADFGMTVAFTGIFGAAILGGPSYVYSAEPPAKIDPDKLSIDELVKQAKAGTLEANELEKLCEKSATNRSLIAVLKAAASNDKYRDIDLVYNIAYAYYSSADRFFGEAAKTAKKDKKLASELYEKGISDANSAIKTIDGKYKSREEVAGNDLSLLASAHITKGDILFALRRHKESADTYKAAYTILQKRLKAEEKYDGREDDRKFLLYSKAGWLQTLYYGEFDTLYREAMQLRKDGKAEEAKAKLQEVLNSGNSILVAAGVPNVETLEKLEEELKKSEDLNDTAKNLLRYTFKVMASIKK